MNVKSIHQEIESLKKEIDTNNKRMKDLRNRATEAEKRLFNVMKERDIQKVEKYSLESLRKKYETPKVRLTKENKNKLKQRRIGILSDKIDSEDAEAVYDEMMKISLKDLEEQENDVVLNETDDSGEESSDEE